MEVKKKVKETGLPHILATHSFWSSKPITSLYTLYTSLKLMKEKNQECNTAQV
jgi:hypothetical protein